jgi:hypothetical protein
MKILGYLFAGSLALLALSAMPVQAASFVYNFTSDHCSGTGGCSSNGALNPMGTVTVTDNGANTVSVDVTLAAGFKFVVTGAGTGNSGNASFFFNTTSGNTITINSLTSGWSIPNVTNGNQQAAGQYAGDGLMNLYNHGVTCSSCGNGGGGGVPPPLDFNVTLAGLTAANFASSPFFAADVISSNGNTGLIDASPATPPIPEPTSIALFGSVLVFTVSKLRRKLA